MKPLLLRIDDAAALLSVGRTKIYQLIREGFLPTVSLAGDKRVPRVAVERLVANAMRPAKESEPFIASEPMVPPDLSGLSDEELWELEQKGREAASSSTPKPPMVAPKPPPNRGGRPKGYPVSGAAKVAKERAQERREREQKRREPPCWILRASTIPRSLGRPRWTTRKSDESGSGAGAGRAVF